MDDLTPSKRRALRAQAHHLQPVVAIGQHGLTPAVLHEIDLALLKHELIKVRVFADDRAQRESVLAAIGAELGCIAVQHLGKLLIIYRENPELKRPAAKSDAAKVRSGSGKKHGAKVTGTKGIKKTYRVKSAARTPIDPVRERRRSTAEPIGGGKGTRGAARFQSGEDPTAPEDSRRSRKPAAAAPAPDNARRSRKFSESEPGPDAARRSRKPPGEAPAPDAARRSRKPSVAASAPDNARRSRKPAEAAAPPDTTRRRRRTTP